MIRTYRNLPAIPSGYPLDDVWSVVVPIARTNEVTNPSAETNTTSYTTGAGTLTRSTEQQYHGAYSLKYVPSAAVADGFYYGTITTTSGQIRAISCKFRGVAGVPYALTLATTGGVDLVAKPFIATGRWQWLILYHTETSSTTRRIYFRKNSSSSVGAFYVDGVQSEVINAGELASTYLDGDQLGLVPNQSPAAYYWNGTPHASTSTRSAQTRAGGMVIPFRKYGFILTALIGLGMAGVQNVATDYARIDGAYDDYTRKPPRQFTLTGRFQGRTYGELRRNRSGLAQLFDRDLTGQDQRLTLLRHVEDGDGRIVSSTVRSISKYESGFSGNTDNMHAETVPITFTQYMPNILADGEAGAALDVQDSVTNANALIKRSPSGVWSSLATGLSGGTSARAILAHPNGYVYIGGQFTAAGASGADYVTRYDPSTNTFANIAGSDTTFNNTVLGLALHPDGRIIVVGSFTNASGNPLADGIAVINPVPDNISAMFTGASADVFCCAVDSLGLVWAGALSTTDFGGVANTNGISYYDGAAWNALGTGLGGGEVDTILPVGNRMYIGGTFPSVNGVANTAFIAYYDIDDSLWHSVTSGTFTGSFISDMVLMPNGTILIVGTFTVIGGVSASNAAIYNGTSFQQVGAGFTGVGEIAAVNPIDKTAWAGGNFTVTNGVTLSSPLVQITGGSTGNAMTIVGAGIDLPGSPKVRAIAFGADGTLYIGFDTSGTALALGTATVTNVGTARSYPTITITGPTTLLGTARIYQIVNATTGRAIYLNLTLNAGETARLVFQPDSLSFTSDFQGNIASSILGGSNEADFFLQPGANTIQFFAADSTVTATIQWRPAFVSMDDVP